MCPCKSLTATDKETIMDFVFILNSFSAFLVFSFIVIKSLHLPLAITKKGETCFIYWPFLTFKLTHVYYYYYY